MHSMIKISLSLFLFLSLYTSSYAVHTTVKHAGDDIFIQMMDQLSMDQIANMDRKEIEQQIGRKFKLTERAGLVLGKYKINRLFKKGLKAQEVKQQMGRGDFSFSIGGFLLGFFLSLIGVLLAWLFWGRKGLKSAIFGAIFNILLIWLGWSRL